MCNALATKIAHEGEASSKNFNNADVINYLKNVGVQTWSLDCLHHMVECLLKLSYKLSVKKWRCKEVTKRLLLQIK